MGRGKGLVVGLVVVIAAIVGVAFFLMQGGQEPAASGSPSVAATETAAASVPPSEAAPSATPPPSVEPSAQAGPITVAWEPITGLEAAATVMGVAFIDGRWLALGQEFPAAAIWTSTDGRTWTRATIDGFGGANEYSFVTDVVELDGALVAIGSWGALQSDQSAWTTFRSTDGGATWTENRDGPAPYALHAITAGGPGVVAGGWEYAGTVPFDSFIATSEDGSAFTIADGRFVNSEVHDLAVIGDRIVAVGNAWIDAPEFAPDTAAWISDDGGTTWTPVEVPDGGTSETISDLVAFGDGLVAIGGGGSVGAWVTADGMTWERFDVAASAQSVAIASVRGSLVAVGNTIGQDIGPGASWISVDGRTWVEGGALGDGSVRHSSVASDGELLVAGGECLAQSCASVLWVGVVSP